MNVRFHRPVYHGETVTVSVRERDDGRVCVQAGECASGIAWIHEEQLPSALLDGRAVGRKAPSVETLQAGTALGTIAPRIDLRQARLSAPLDPALHGRVHPAIMLGLANQIFVENYELGPWIHVESEVRKFGSAKDGDELSVRGRVEDRYERKGHEFVVLDVQILKEARIIERVRHTAIWRPRVTR